MTQPTITERNDVGGCIEPSLVTTLARAAVSVLAIFTLASAAIMVAVLLDKLGASDFQQGVGATAFGFWWPRLFIFCNKHAER